MIADRRKMLSDLESREAVSCRLDELTAYTKPLKQVWHEAASALT